MGKARREAAVGHTRGEEQRAMDARGGAGGAGPLAAGALGEGAGDLFIYFFIFLKGAKNKEGEGYVWKRVGGGVVWV